MTDQQFDRLISLLVMAGKILGNVGVAFGLGYLTEGLTAGILCALTVLQGLLQENPVTLPVSKYLRRPTVQNPPVKGNGEIG